MILDQADEKIKHFNSIGIHYEAVYHYVMTKRLETGEIFNSDFIDDITAGLISFDMQRMMGTSKYISEGKQSWASKLQKILSFHQTTLQKISSFSLQHIDLSSSTLQEEITHIFNELSKSGPNGLNRRKLGERFPVGASKILHFLIPDLFIIVDSNARRELAKFYGIRKSFKFDGQLYLTAMQAYQNELKVWAKKNNDLNLNKLLELDSSYKEHGGTRKTPLPRTIDKCTFVGSQNIIPSDCRPQRFDVFIGGYMGTSYHVEMKDKCLIYQMFDIGYELKENQKIIPTTQQWAKFWNRINNLKIWDWGKNYPNPGICDGTQWEINILYNERQLETCGDNNYPNSSDSQPGKEFASFLEALRTLLGGVSLS